MSMTNSIDRVEIITSVQRRRRWTASEKVRIVEECCYVPLLFSVRCLSLALHRHRSQRAPNTASTRRVTRERPCGRGPWLRASSPVRRQKVIVLPAAMDWSLTCGRTEIKLIPVVVSGKRHEPRVPSPLP